MANKQEVIGFLINNVIYTGQDAIAMVRSNGGYDTVITKDHAKFMKGLDLGYTWDRLGEAPILFIVEEGQIRMPTIKENEYKYYVWDKNNTVPQERFEYLE